MHKMPDAHGEEGQADVQAVRDPGAGAHCEASPEVAQEGALHLVRSEAIQADPPLPGVSPEVEGGIAAPLRIQSMAKGREGSSAGGSDIREWLQDLAQGNAEMKPASASGRPLDQSPLDQRMFWKYDSKTGQVEPMGAVEGWDHSDVVMAWCTWMHRKAIVEQTLAGGTTYDPLQLVSTSFVGVSPDGSGKNLFETRVFTVGPDYPHSIMQNIIYGVLYADNLDAARRNHMALVSSMSPPAGSTSSAGSTSTDELIPYTSPSLPYTSANTVAGAGRYTVTGTLGGPNHWVFGAGEA